MNLADVLLRAADASPDARALTWAGGSTTYAELADRSARVAGALAADGRRPGDRVGIVCGNTPAFVVAYLGALRAGAVAVPVNPLGTVAEVEAEFAGTGTQVAIVDHVGQPVVGRLVEEGRAHGLTVVDGGGSGWEAFTSAEPAATVDRSGDDPAVLVHTSGTSGPARAAVLTHANLASNIDQMQRHPGMRVEEGDVVLAVLPFFHVFGLNAVLGLGLATGVELVLVERFDPAATLATISEHGATVVAGVPAMYAAWLAVPDADAAAFRSVRLAVSGAAPLPPDIQAGMRDRFGVDLHQGYGLTEASPVVAAELGTDRPRPGSIGVPVPGVEVRLVDSSGDDVLVGDPGEIWVRGPNVFAGYWGDDETTARVLVDGWLHTGDVAVADDEGRLSIVDRSKDLIIVSGFNVYPAEVEEVLVEHPDVEEAAVVGIPDDQTGEAVKAYVVAAPGASPDPADVIAFAGRSLARYKCPVEVEVVDSLPRGLAGKLLRRRLSGTGPDASGAHAATDVDGDLTSRNPA